MALPNKDQQKFHSYQDANLLMEAIEKRYGGNKESKKVQRTLLKQQYKNFSASSSETLDQTFDRMQKLISQLEIQGEVIQQEDMNLKLLRSLPSEWKTHALIWGNKEELETISLDDFTISTNKSDTTASGVSTAHTQGTIVNSTSVDNLSDAVIYAFLASQPNSPQLAKEDQEQIDPDDLESPKNQDNIGREYREKTVPVESLIENALIAQDGIEGYDWSYQAEEEIPTNYAFMALTSSGSSSSSESEVDSCSKSCMKAYANLKEKYDSLTSDYKKSKYNLLSYKAGLQSVEERLVHYKKNKTVLTDKINVLNLDVKLRDKVLADYTQNLEKAKKERDELKLTLEKLQNSSKALNNLLDNKEYHAVPPPLTENYMPPKRYLRLIDEHFESVSMDVISNIAPSDVKTVKLKHKTVDVNHKDVFSIEEPKHVMKNKFSPPIIEDWHSDDKSEEEISPTIEVKTVKPSVEKIKSVKPARETVKTEESLKQLKHHPRETSAILLILKLMMVDLFPLEMEKAEFLKGKQHKASYKAKLMNTISKPLHMFHMDLFGPTNVKSLMKKSYCLVVTDDFSRFPWVFFLATKGETSRILKTFITRIENQLDCKVKVIRSDNGTEFKNSVMNQFYEDKGINREYSVARTLQQNRVAERRNGTLIEATITMTRRVEETLNIRFPEYTPNVKGNRPDWLFDIDSLTISMNYVLVVTGNKTNGIAGSKENLVADESEASDNIRKNDQVPRSEVESLFQQERQTENINSTNSVNTVSLPVNTVGSSFVNAASQTPINAAGPSAITNAFEEHFFERFSTFKNAFSLPHVPIVAPYDDTRIFDNAYDDEVLKGKVDMNNVDSSLIDGF
nr:putative ribonuclease H-like domain-containing protein [Tanacetum cinerariifolium]